MSIVQHHLHHQKLERMKIVVIYIYIYLNPNNNNNYINNHGLTQYILESKRERVRELERQRIGCNIIMPNKRSYAQQKKHESSFYLLFLFGANTEPCTWGVLQQMLK